MAEARAVNPLVAQFRRGGVPRDLRLIAAQGALPLTTADLVELLQLLEADHDAEIAGTAAATLGELPAAELLPIVKDRETASEVLVWTLRRRAEVALLEAVLQNVSLPDEAIREQAPTLPEALAELVVINQTRLLRCTPLLEAIESNPNLSKDQQRRLRELRESFHIGEQPPVAAPPSPPPPPPAPEPIPEPVFEEPPLSEDDALARYLTADERSQEDKVSSVQRLYKMGVAEKVITALKGSREERAILVRDPNRLVATAVLGSPRLTEAEIESFAGMKSLSDDALRTIASHREWTKRYGVISNLVRNPRTPIALSLGFVSRLNPRDIKNLAVDRNVPEVIRKQAQKFIRSTYETKK